MLACHSGPLDDGEAAIRPFRELGTPLADLSGKMPFVEVQQVLDADYPNGRNYYWKSSYLEALDDAAIDALIERTKTRPSPLTSIDIWALGGAIARVPADQTAFAQRTSPILIGVESNWDEADMAEENVGWARGVIYDMKPYESDPARAPDSADLEHVRRGEVLARARHHLDPAATAAATADDAGLRATRPVSGLPLIPAARHCRSLPAPRLA